jgi:hypothetical protein
MKVQNWNLDKETLDFNYCFLSIRTEVIDNAVVKFKMIPAVKGYKQHIFSGPQTGLGFTLLEKI